VSDINDRTIPLTDVAWQHRQVRDEIQAAFDRLLDDPTCDGTPFVDELEALLSDHFGPPWHVVTAQSGVAAQTLLLRALDIGPGDEVITIPNSDLSTTAAISQVGATFVLVDVAEGGFQIDPAAAERAITPRTKAILPVHMYGTPAPMPALQRIAKAHDLRLIEDAALGLGAELDGARAGTFGDGAFFSFAPRKILGGIGNGGMALVEDPAVAHRVRELRGYGLDPEVQDLPIAERHLRPGLHHVAEGYNLRLDGIQAAIVSAKVRRLEAWAELRCEVADRYDERFAGVAGIETPVIPAGARPAWRNYTVLLDDRDGLRHHLYDRGITTGTLYAPPVHLQPVYAHLGIGPGSFPVAEAQAKRNLCLPIYPGLERAQVDRIADEVIAFLRAA
jgi:dTDP-4-amino-4,6-dideoxygalactose transaminase